MYFRAILKAAVVGLFLVACLFAPAMSAETWTQVRTKNFFLIGDASELEIRRAGARLEQFRETFRQLFPQMKLDGGIKTNVVVFKNNSTYAPFKPKRPDGTVDNAVAGYFQAGEDVNYITLSVGDRSNPYSTIFHEYVHFLLDANVGRTDLPPWLGEGLAEYYETLQVLEGQRVSLGTPPDGHLSLLRQNDLIPFKTFLATDNSSLHRGGDDSRTLFYAQAWALTHYLLHSEKNKGGNHLDELLSSLKNDAAPGKVFDKMLGPDEAALETALRKYIDQPLPPNRLVAITQKVDLNAVVTAAPLSDSQAAAYLGDLLYHTRNLTEAEALLRKALAVDANSGIANMSLGLIYSQKKNFIEAKKYLEKAIVADKTNHLAYFNYAYAVSRESIGADGNVSEFPAAAANKMRDALHRAIAIDSGFAESYRLLAFVNLVNGIDLDGSVDLIKRGLAIRPGDQQFNLLLAQVYLLQERYEDARAIATKIAATASDAEIWAEAQGILRTVNKYFAEKDAGADESSDANRIFGPLPPLILKRSAVSDADVAKYEEDRVLLNLNVLLEKPRFGEKQIVGYVDKITCTDNGINYTVTSGSERFSLVSNDFIGIKLGVLTEGERSFTLDCGASLGKQLTVLTFKPTPGVRPNVRGHLLSITFVPDYFRLKTAEELANRRTVIIEDDKISKSRSVKTDRP